MGCGNNNNNKKTKARNNMEKKLFRKQQVTSLTVDYSSAHAGHFWVISRSHRRSQKVAFNWKCERPCKKIDFLKKNRN